MTIENNLEKIVSDYMTSGAVEAKVAEKLEQAVDGAADDLFTRYGGLRTQIEEKIKSVMEPIIENADYSAYIVKLEAVMGEILEKTTLDNRKILENFKELVTEVDEKEIKLNKLFDKYSIFVSKNVDTSNLNEDNDGDGPVYQDVDVSVYVEYEDGYSWSSYENAKVVFECEQDESLNVELRLWKRKDKENWELSSGRSVDFSKLRTLNSFAIEIMKLDTSSVEIIIDTEHETVEVEVEEKPYE